MIVSRVFESRQRKRKNISIVLSSQEKDLLFCRFFFNGIRYYKSAGVKFTCRLFFVNKIKFCTRILSMHIK